MASVNQCNFIGNVGKIETRYMQSGEAVTNLSLACNESWKNKAGEKQEKVEWINCVLYRKLAEIAENHVHVGNQLFVSGKLSTRKWQTKDGQDRYTTEVIVSEMTMLGGNNVPRETSGQGEGEKTPQKASGGLDDMDSDIPFN